MDKTKIFSLAAAIVMVGILALGWFVGIDPQLKAKASTDEQRISVEAQNTATELTIAELMKDFESITTLKAELEDLRGSIPAEGDLPTFLSQLDSLATESSTKVTSLEVSEAIPYTAPVTSVAPVEEPTDGETENPDPPTEVPLDGPEVPQTITDPRITSANFVAIPVEVVVEGNLEGAQSFVDKLQHGQRLFMATNISIAPSGDDVTVYTATVSGYVYVLPKE